MADHGHKKKAPGLAARGRKLGDASRKRENAFKSLQDRTGNIGRTAKQVDEMLNRAIQRLEKRMNRGHQHQERRMKQTPKERGA